MYQCDWGRMSQKQWAFSRLGTEIIMVDDPAEPFLTSCRQQDRPSCTVLMLAHAVQQPVGHAVRTERSSCHPCKACNLASSSRMHPRLWCRHRLRDGSRTSRRHSVAPRPDLHASPSFAESADVDIRAH